MSAHNLHPKFTNETVLSYAPDSAERQALIAELDAQQARVLEIPAIVGGERIASGSVTDVRAPHAHHQQLGRIHNADAGTIHAAIDAAVAAQRDWSQATLAERAAVFLKAADLLAGPWRARLNAATMLGQSKTAYQAEIDSACELIDFLRFNVQFAHELANGQPISSPGMRNHLEYRPLEGFVYAVTPFNFTAIGGNLAIAPALMGNTVVWKPAATALLSNFLFMELLEAAGLPKGVINFLPGDPVAVSGAVLARPELAGIHFTGSTAVFDTLWGEVGRNVSRYRSYPRLVGETGGKDFVLAHASADVEALAVALLRGAFEYQGQKCSAASRAYVPASLWPQVRARLVALVETIRMGDVTDFTNFMGAVIDRRAFDRIDGHLQRAAADSGVKVVAGGKTDASVGYFIAPTVLEVDNPRHTLMETELFGPVLSVYVYADKQWPEVLALVDSTSPYALTGAVFATERAAIAQAADALRFAAGNFYINDKPTGAVVGQQPFGGARRSGTNDKAGSALNLLRWVSPRTVKETFVPPSDYRYAHMAA
ncbi:L-glutamate gamma-semialdehyde dehydrogenase [Cupriavidus pauculus]|uniref:L-glutamate gamma-semialdehyde dehydrogenase n=1 Tax=Cupriavidus pauculus TaxID=82633 RepID=UPI001247A533|nr:L-glutamate gamma-semialdehyde dehydrogenase [Cupriavidus pauculus]KAB0602693.1 L-glutamate gamma-semialdehyde dehydrogenase [Cupriavidus pauculus]UAL02862.1 L-glutamate gamma-semialdehyde dehydrogenase [Cupriavidus pauculus]